MRTTCRSSLGMLLLLAAACQDGVAWNTAPDAVTHQALFPIASGHHALGSGTPAISCATCHGGFDTFKKFDCLTCHATVALPGGAGLENETGLGNAHRGMGGYAYSSEKCYSCHADGTKSGSMPNSLINDPARDVSVTALLPSFAGPVITGLTGQALVLPMAMNHQAKAVNPAAFTSCAGCHPNAGTGNFLGGLFHSSLTALNMPQPKQCTECHTTAATAAMAAAQPTGFVGPVDAARKPASGAMRHDAHIWTAAGPGLTLAVPQECGACHLAPTAAKAAHWSTGASGGGPALLHASLKPADQPGSCLDCHANSRPAGVVSTPGAAGAAVQFDHAAPSTLGECTACHQASLTGYASWSGGVYHQAGAAAPSSCLPCHGGERPASTAGWASSTYTNAPFDYLPNAQGVKHGDGQDCVTCHAGPGTGTWGGAPRQNWVGGHFEHAGSPVAKVTCLACHSTQRPDLQPGGTGSNAANALGFDHALNGTGDCAGCHQATVAAGKYVSYTFPGGDWRGGREYPGSTPVGSPASGVTVLETLLNRAATGLVTGATTQQSSYFTNMVHTSTAVPPQLDPGPDTSPRRDSCWHCHTHAAGSTTVTSFANGDFHGSLTGYAATVTGPVTGLPEPLRCLECHAPMRPQGIVGPTTQTLQGMDHAALFTAPVTVGGAQVTGVAGMDCGLCHKPPTAALGLKFSDGLFHANLGAAQPADCVACHYPLMADAARADLPGAGSKAKMLHRSPQLTSQACQKCHTDALSKAQTAPPASALWQYGSFHRGAGSAQPASCLECHAASLPAGATPSSVTYNFPSGGGTSTNGTQWMNHAAQGAVNQDCNLCHLADASVSSASNGYSKASLFHRAVPSPAACQACHGVTNGNGAALGTKNNLPSGPTDSTVVTTAGSTTGVAATTHAQIAHADINVSGKECNLCHVAPGAATPGTNWTQASFHSKAGPLVMNGTTGRCSTCHVTEKPTAAGFPTSHSSYTEASGTTDCASCHSYPGTGSSGAPNWLGAKNGAPTTVVVGGFPITSPGSGTQTSVTIPHPTNTNCASCHTGGAGGKGAIGYDHSSSAASCNTCHELGSTLLAPAWNKATSQGAGLGDTRPSSLTSTSTHSSWDGNSCTWSGGTHFYPQDCGACHRAPSGVSTGATTSSTFQSKWLSTGHLPKNGKKSQGICAECHNHGC